MFEENNKSQRGKNESVRRKEVMILFPIVLFCRFRQEAKVFFKTCRFEKCSAILLFSIAFEASFLQTHFSCWYKLLLNQKSRKKPSKHPRELFQVKQIFMFIFCLKFMKQYVQNTLFDINDFDCKYIIGLNFVLRMEKGVNFESELNLCFLFFDAVKL